MKPRLYLYLLSRCISDHRQDKYLQDLFIVLTNSLPGSETTSHYIQVKSTGNKNKGMRQKATKSNINPSLMTVEHAFLSNRFLTLSQQLGLLSNIAQMPNNLLIAI